MAPTPTVADLLSSGRLEAVPPDDRTAVQRLKRAEQHLKTAAALLGQDNDVAYGSLYDAARKAVTAHMLAHGLRAPGRAGAHEAVGIYAAERITNATASATEFQRIRRWRNKSEYEDLSFGAQDVAADLQHATNIVAAVQALLSPSPLGRHGPTTT